MSPFPMRTVEDEHEHEVGRSLGLVVSSIAEAEVAWPGFSRLRAVPIEARLVGFARLLAARARGRLAITVIYDTTTGEVMGFVPTTTGGLGFATTPITLPQASGLAARAVQLAAGLLRVTSKRDLEECLIKQSFHRALRPEDRVLELDGLVPTESSADTEEPLPFQDRLFDSYHDEECARITAPGHIRPPQPREVGKLLRRLLTILYPGYRGPLPTEHHFESTMKRLVSVAQTSLCRLVQRALAFEAAVVKDKRLPRNPLRAEAERIVRAFFDAIPGIRRMLDADTRAAYEGDPAVPKCDHHIIPLAYPGLYAISIYRLANILYLLDVPYVPRMMTELAHQKTGIDIHPGARISRGCFIDHGTGVTVGETAIIGENVTMYQGVTVGALNFPMDDAGKIVRGAKRHPTIKFGTKIFASASLLGDIQVGENSVIGANVSLRRSVDPESIVRVPAPFRELSIAQIDGEPVVTPATH